MPSRATINRVLGRADLLARNPRKRPKSSWRRFSYARPRDCFQIDGTEHTLADGTVVVAIDIIDDCSLGMGGLPRRTRRDNVSCDRRTDRRHH